MSDVAALMKRCQIGVPRGPNAYDDLHSILADCYGTMGALGADNARLQDQCHRLTSTCDGMTRFRREEAEKAEAELAALREALQQIVVAADMHPVHMEQALGRARNLLKGTSHE